jgi:hypothetical protein
MSSPNNFQNINKEFSKAQTFVTIVGIVFGNPFPPEAFLGEIE